MKEGILIGVLLGLIASCTLHDDTDPGDGSRSGMGIKVDALTGCEYLVVPGGGIASRMHRDGTQVCRGGSK